MLLGLWRTSILSPWLIYSWVYCSSTEMDKDRHRLAGQHPLDGSSCPHGHSVLPWCSGCSLVGIDMRHMIKAVCACTHCSFGSRSSLNVTHPPPTPSAQGSDPRKEHFSKRLIVYNFWPYPLTIFLASWLNFHSL